MSSVSGMAYHSIGVYGLPAASPKNMSGVKKSITGRRNEKPSLGCIIQQGLASYNTSKKLPCV